MPHRLLVAVAGVFVSLLFSACGDSSSTSKGDASSSTSPASTTSTVGSTDGEPSAAFAGSGRNGELATAGTESNAEEREAASMVLEANLRAREAGNYVGQCRTLTPQLVRRLEIRVGKGILKTSCPASVEGMAQQARPGQLDNPMVEPLAALRVNGNLAFAFFHGAGGKDYVMPMQKVGGEWKVASLNTQQTP